MTIDTSLYTKMADLVECDIQQGHNSQSTIGVRVWFDYANQEITSNFKGEILQVSTTFDIEIIGDTKGETEPIANTLKTGLRAFRGTMGEHQVTYSEVEDHNGSYAPRGPSDGDEGRVFSALQVSFLHSEL